VPWRGLTRQKAAASHCFVTKQRDGSP